MIRQLEYAGGMPAAVFTADQQAKLRTLLMFERLLQIVGLVLMTIGATIGGTLYVTQPGYAMQAQETRRQTVEDLRIAQAQSDIKTNDIARRLDQMETRELATETFVHDQAAAVSRIYGFGGGMGSLIVVLQAFQILSQKSKQS